MEVLSVELQKYKLYLPKLLLRVGENSWSKEQSF